jgi:hypothetical protein
MSSTLRRCEVPLDGTSLIEALEGYYGDKGATMPRADVLVRLVDDLAHLPAVAVLRAFDALGKQSGPPADRAAIGKAAHQQAAVIGAWRRAIDARLTACQDDDAGRAWRGAVDALARYLIPGDYAALCAVSVSRRFDDSLDEKIAPLVAYDVLARDYRTVYLVRDKADQMRVILRGVHPGRRVTINEALA